MSKAKMDALQIGTNATASQNMHLRANNDGTFTLARGNVGAPLGNLLTIDASGRVKTPQSVSAFSAYNTGFQSLANATSTKLTLPLELYDFGSGWDTATSRFTAPVSGVYAFSGCIQFAGGSGNGQLFLYKNGAVSKRAALIANSAGSTQLPLSGSLLLNAGDYIELWAYQSSGGALNVGSNAGNLSFDGHLVGAT